MGPELADICLGDAAPAEFGAEPLIGLRGEEHFLHDGRGGTPEQAIALHAGKASVARDRFAELKLNDGESLLALPRGARRTTRCAPW